PKADIAYRLALDDRPGRSFNLPPAAASGVAMTVLDPVTAPGRPVRVRLVSAKGDRSLVVGAYTRGRLADTKTVAAKAGEPVEVTLLAGHDPRGGVVRLTAFEDAGGFRPVAERLAFRRPGEVLNLALGATTTGADGAVSLPVAATDEKGNPAAAILWAAAVNTASVPGAKDRSLPTHFLLAGEIETPDDLEHADFLLTDHPAAAAGLDLVLATQGWRRFVEQGQGPVARRSPAADRLLAMNGASPIGPDESPAHRRLFETHWPRYEESVREMDAAKADRAKADRTAGPNLAQFVAAYEARRRETAALAAAAEEAAAPLIAVRGWVSGAAIGLAGLAVGAVALGVFRPKGVRGLTPLAVSAGGAGLLALVLGQMAPEAGAAPGGEYALDDAPAVAPVDANHVGVPVPPSPPVAPPPRIARITPDGAVAEPRVFSGIGTPEKGPLPQGIPGVNVEPTPAPPRVVIPDSELKQKSADAAGPAMRIMTHAAAPAKRATSPVDAIALQRARGLAVGIEDAFPDAEKRDAVIERLRTAVPWVPPLVAREYAAPRPGSGSPGAVSDTVLWQPLIVLPADGKTVVTFFPGAAAGGYEVVVAGHTPDGRIGTVRRVVPGARK
ncbi:MAG TPA: hypothetical protein VH092_03620, partial [Urbifossiella sp.]|nr:hypothetical protein [Urbifossiella sp.]